MHKQPINSENKRSVFIKILSEICSELNYTIELKSQGWLIKISKRGSSKYIFGYSFPLNPDSSSQICKDKAATTAVLNSFNIPNIQHKIFHIYKDYNNSEGNWLNMINFFNDNNQKIVIKPNEGSSGTGVFIVENLFDLEFLVYKKLKERPTLCLSPFEKIKWEYRVIVLNGKAELVYKKVIPELIGDGKKTILELLNTFFVEINNDILKYLTEKGMSLHHVLNANEKIKLNWKHNLGKGANIQIEINQQLKSKIEAIALKTAKAMGMNFASIDVIENEKGELLIIEVNSGIMLVNFALKGEKEYAIAKAIYKKGIEKMMN